MKHILIIEDDKAIAELERDYLEANGFKTTLCFDGVIGEQVALKDTFDLIILDIMLPGIHGFTICEHIRQCKHVPILFVSAKREDIDKIQGLGLGANDYIVKPFQPRELVARVHAHIANYERLTGVHKIDELVIANLTIHLASHEVYIDNTLVILPNKEYELLLFLAQNANIIFTKEQLFETIWGLDAIGELNTVTVHINRIRDKIEKNKLHTKFIETIWGSGYKFKK